MKCKTQHSTRVRRDNKKHNVEKRGNFLIFIVVKIKSILKA